jgi:hypothetical protein
MKDEVQFTLFIPHPSALIPSLLAERVGFEPTERFPVHSISSAANSTTLAPLRKLAPFSLLLLKTQIIVFSEDMI